MGGSRGIIPAPRMPLTDAQEWVQRALPDEILLALQLGEWTYDELREHVVQVLLGPNV